MRKNGIEFLVVLLLMMVLGGPSPAAERGGTLVMGMRGDMDTLCPLTTGVDPTQLSLSFMYLADYNEDYKLRPNYGPQLAERWEWNEPHTMLTVRLKDDVRWHDGEPVTAHDVKYTYEAALDPATGYQGVSQMYAIKKREKGRPGDMHEIEVIDDLTVSIAIEKPYATAEHDLLRNLMICPAHILSRVPNADLREHPFGRRPVGNGPFKLQEWEKNSTTVYTRNDDFFIDGYPKLDKVVMKVIPESSAQFAAFAAGELNFIGVATTTRDLLEDFPRARIYRYPGRAYYFIAWNTQREIFGDVRMRRAMAYALDKEAITSGAVPGIGEVCASPVLSYHPLFDPAREPYPFIPGEAMRLLDECGWEMSGEYRYSGGKRLEFKLLSTSTGEVYPRLVEIVQQQLKEVGVFLDIEQVEYMSMLDKAEDRDYDALTLGGVMGMTVDFSDYKCEGALRNDSYNWPQYCNPEADRLIDLIKYELDPEARRQHLGDWLDLMEADQPFTYLYTIRGEFAVKSNVKDIRADANGFYPHIWRWRVE